MTSLCSRTDREEANNPSGTKLPPILRRAMSGANPLLRTWISILSSSDLPAGTFPDAFWIWALPCPDQTRQINNRKPATGFIGLYPREKGARVQQILSISRKNALSPRPFEYPPVVRPPSTCLRRDIGRNSSLRSPGMVRRRRRFGSDADNQAERCPAASLQVATACWSRGERLNQKKPACGGAREGGSRAGAVETSLVSR